MEPEQSPWPVFLVAWHTCNDKPEGFQNVAHLDFLISASEPVAAAPESSPLKIVIPIL